MAKSPSNVNDRKKAVKGNQDNIKHNLNNEVQTKKFSRIINLVKPDGTTYGWLFENFYGAKEQLKLLSIDSEDETIRIGNEVFNTFENLKTKYIKQLDLLGMQLWVICIFERGDSEFPLQCHKLYANKIACALITMGIYKASQIMVIPEKQLTIAEMKNLDRCFYVKDPNYGLNLHESIAVKNESLKKLI
jgi:hypothetical protein